MKLYATVTSERASKGQGGNEFIELSVKGDKDQKQELLLIRIVPIAGTDAYNVRMLARMRNSTEGYQVQYFELKGKNADYAAYRASEQRYIDAGKGEKQKGECVHGHVNKETCTDACRQ